MAKNPEQQQAQAEQRTADVDRGREVMGKAKEWAGEKLGSAKEAAKGMFSGMKEKAGGVLKRGWEGLKKFGGSVKEHAFALVGGTERHAKKGAEKVKAGKEWATNKGLEYAGKGSRAYEAMRGRVHEAGNNFRNRMDMFAGNHKLEAQARKKQEHLNVASEKGAQITKLEKRLANLRKDQATAQGKADEVDTEMWKEATQRRSKVEARA